MFARRLPPSPFKKSYSLCFSPRNHFVFGPAPRCFITIRYLSVRPLLLFHLVSSLASRACAKKVGIKSCLFCRKKLGRSIRLQEAAPLGYCRHSLISVSQLSDTSLLQHHILVSKPTNAQFLISIADPKSCILIIRAGHLRHFLFFR